MDAKQKREPWTAEFEAHEPLKRPNSREKEKWRGPHGTGGLSLRKPPDRLGATSERGTRTRDSGGEDPPYVDRSRKHACVSLKSPCVTVGEGYVSKWNPYVDTPGGRVRLRFSQTLVCPPSFVATALTPLLAWSRPTPNGRH